MQETGIPSLGQQDPPEEEVTTHASILAWEIPWTEGLVGYSPKGYKSQTWLVAKQQNIYTENKLVAARGGGKE